MAENSNIEWTHHTFNPWIGCTKVGPGCDHCYAEVWDSRGLQQKETRWGPHAARTRTSAANWRKPLAWDKAAAAAGERHRVFCASLADVFDNHASILPEWRDDLWAVIKATPNLDWMLLTKRPGNIAKMLPPDWGDGYPNVWLGCTVVNEKEADRDIVNLLTAPARVRFLSMEPLLGPVDISFWLRPILAKRSGTIGPGRLFLPALDLVIVGGESGHGARPMHPDWLRQIRDQCIAADVAFFFKQWGEWEVSMDRERDDPDWRADYSNNYIDHGKSRWLNIAGGRGFHGERFHVMRRVGKKAAGRLLDGRTWDQMPGVRNA
jgi:protein gp37